MSRRQTLGAVSPSNLNMRASGNNGPAARVGVKEPIVKARKSMAPSHMDSLESRRSSVHGNKPSGPKQDPRPISDKNFQANCIRTLITYLSTHNYTGQVSPKSLASPTTKDFTLIAQFLFQQFDPHMKPFTKIDDEVPTFFKRINYPFAISKSSLFAIGSPHSWPSVLAALTWLVELLNYNEKTEESRMAGTGFVDEEGKTKKDFFEYISLSYRYFLGGDDARCQAVDEDMLSQFREKERTVVGQRARLREANNAVLAELETLRAQPSPLTAATMRLEEHRVDAEKFEKLIDNLQSLKVSLQRKLAEREADVKSKVEAMHAAAAENEALKARVAAQPVSKADVTRMQMERSKQKETLEAITSQCEEMEGKVHTQEVQIVAELKALDSSVMTYNQLAHRLKLVPASAKRADGITYEMRINRQATSPSGLSNLDLKGVIKPGLERLCERYHTKAGELNRDLVSLKEQLSATMDAANDKQEENLVIEQQIRNLEAQLKTLRENQDEKVRGVTGEAGRLQEEVHVMRGVTSARLADLEARRKAASLELDAANRVCEAEMATLKADLQTALEAMVAHRMHIQQRLEPTMACMKGVLSQIQGMPLPSA